MSVHLDEIAVIAGSLYLQVPFVALFAAIVAVYYRILLCIFNLNRLRVLLMYLSALIRFLAERRENNRQTESVRPITWLYSSTYTLKHAYEYVSEHRV